MWETAFSGGEGSRVDEVMTRPVETIGPETSLKEVAGLLWTYEIRGMPVIDEHGHPLGVISQTDIVLEARGESRERRPLGLFGGYGPRTRASKVRARTAGEAMSAPAITIEPAAPLSEAAERMLSYGLHRLLVVFRGRLVGIVTRHDLMGAFARDDAELEREIRDEPLAGLNWPDALELTVRSGEVAMHGQVDSMRDAAALPVQVRRILGVVSVDAELRAWDPRGEHTQVVTTHI